MKKSPSRHGAGTALSNPNFRTQRRNDRGENGGAPATTEHKARLKTLSPEAVKESSLAGEPIVAKLSHAAGNSAPLDGLKVIAHSGWCAARPSGTEAVYKIYAESFKDEAHLDAIVRGARKMVNAAVAASGAPVIENGQAG